eukprot:403332087
MQQAMNYQTRRAEDKTIESERRTKNLEQAPVDITPQNGKNFFWSNGKQNIDEIENEYSFKKVTVRGMFDFTKEVQVEKDRNGEKGVQIVVPFYTHLNEKGEPCAILVNRGWVPYDLKNYNMHSKGVQSGEITGILYRGENKNKYSKPNTPIEHEFTRVEPYDIAVYNQLKNWEEASKFMLYQYDNDQEHRQILPTLPTAAELAQWKVSAERHQAYANMWKYLTFGGVVANTALWLYF